MNQNAIAPRLTEAKGRLVQLYLTKFPRTFAAGPTRKRIHFKVYQGSKSDRWQLLNKIYAPCQNLENNSKEWIQLAESGRVWHDYYQPFDLTKIRKWAKENIEQLNRLQDYKTRFRFSRADVSDAIKSALSHQSVKIEGYSLRRGDSEVIYDRLKNLTGSFKDDDIYSRPPKVDEIIIGNENLKSHQDDVIMFRNNVLAQQFALDKIATKRDINEDDIKALNRLILMDTVSNDNLPLRFKTNSGWDLRHTNVIGEYRHVFSQAHGCHTTIYSYPREVPANMKLLLQQCNNEALQPTLHRLVYAAYFYATFLHIHPFMDGNGRVARLLFTVMMLREEYCPPVFQEFDRDEYIEALYLMTSEHQPNAWLSMICDSVEDQFKDVAL